MRTITATTASADRIIEFFGENDLDHLTTDQIRAELAATYRERNHRIDNGLDVEDQEWRIGRCRVALDRR
ncbi:hypothetical protein [Nocardia sp. CA-290969]|uniref:hypothetical protein n=1 Tax=Nocardia sp. CA-290969 TaxID=3239986 RepID=UPI003D944A24